MSEASTATEQQQTEQQQQQTEQQQTEQQQQTGLLGRDEQETQQQEAAAEWLSALPDELKGDATLGRYKSVEDLARGHLEAHKVAKSKVVLPKDDDPESFDRFAAAVRPESADAYEIELPDGSGTDFADAMRPVFHGAGLLPQQVNKLVEANNKFVAEQQAALDRKGQEEFDALEAEMGKTEFERGKMAATNMLNKLGIEPKFEEDLSRMIGTGNTLRTLFAIAEKTGELGRVDANDINLALGGLKGEDAMKAAREMQNDPEVAKKLEDKNSAEFARYDQLRKAAAQK
ncbi:MAG: hypothetical protein CL472_06085 [Acidobacteria bacterium]|nr:hypothetical protein [Acidobacteriota bacterium]